MAVGVALLSAATEAVNVVNALEFGATGGVVLGPFSFYGFEVPSHIEFGGAHAMTVHRLPGGERVVDLLGPDESDISWSGTFINSTGINLVQLDLDTGDQDPDMRAGRLDQMRAEGRPLPLIWGTSFYTVLIRNVRFEKRYGLVQYSISCCVLRNEATAPPAESQADTTSAVTDDLNSAAEGAPASAAPAVTQAQEALPTPPIPPGEPLPTPPIPPGEPLPLPPIPPGTPPAAVTQQAVSAEAATVTAPVSTPFSFPPPHGFAENFAAGLGALP